MPTITNRAGRPMTRQAAKVLHEPLRAPDGQRVGRALPAAEPDFAGLMATPALQWPEQRTPVSSQEHGRRRAAIRKLVEQSSDVEPES